jgi:hypothetical protein
MRAAIAAVAADVAEPLPPAFVAVTVTRMQAPTSLVVNVYDWLVAPETATQAPPVLSQRFHWYE